ncbi:hypothetical protein F4779DRAFT_621758 [Xylariaceae sp. FL0662B]|nr:hypothetical protein F4779DRAFT_621758 [Xylariaceae sp. FL0662B]
MNNAFSPSYASFQKLEDPPKLPVIGNQPKWDIAKIVLRSISLAVALASIVGNVVVNVSLINIGKTNWGLVTAVLICVWDICEFVVMCIRRSKARGIKPYFHVGVELVLWLAAFITMVLQVSALDPAISPEKDEASKALTQWLKIYQLLLLVEGILHFVLFIRACVEVDRKRKDRRMQQLILAVQRQNQHSPTQAYSAHGPNSPGYMYNNDTAQHPQHHQDIPLSPLAAPASPSSSMSRGPSFVNQPQMLESPQHHGPRPVELMGAAEFAVELPADCVFHAHEMAGSRTSGLSTAAAARRAQQAASGTEGTAEPKVLVSDGAGAGGGSGAFFR